jgi:hypothetical protein
MTEKRLYEVINPSDMITFRAAVTEAACIANRLGAAWYFVKDMETGNEPEVADLQSEYDAIWKDADKLASYAEAYRSFLVGSRSDEALAYRAKYHDRQRSSMNDICAQAWETAEKIAVYTPEVA